MSSRPTATRVVKYIRKGVADCHLIKAVSYSAYTNSSGTYVIKDVSKVTFDDTTVLEVISRGITMLLLNATTGAKLYQNTFDTYDDSNTYSPKLVSALSSYKATANAVLVLVSRDAMTLTSDVITALQDYGCGEVDAVTEPSRAAFAFIGQSGVPTGHAYYELRNYENAEVSLQASVTNGALIQRGADGADAVTIQASGENIVFTKVGQVAYVYVDAYKGQVQIAYQDDFYCSAFNRYLFDKSVYWGFSTANNRFFYIFKLLKKADLDEELTYTATVNGVAYKRTIHIKTVYDGENGDRGPALRGPQAWNDCAEGYSFQSGADGEEYKDVVLYNSNYYSCIASHTKTADNYPTSTLDTNNGYWKLADKFEIIATNILLAQYALVKNLGVEAIEMYDKNGDALFKVLKTKDSSGNEIAQVICNTGTFNNIKVETGQIAGFKVSGNGLTNSPFTNDAYVIFRNDAHACFAGIGGNVFSTETGLRGVARFENEDTSDWWGLGKNIALYLSAKNAALNWAFCGTGNGHLNGWISGFKFSKFTITTANKIYNGYTKIAENNKWLVVSKVSNSGVALPLLADVRGALGIGNTTNFCIEFTILADTACTNNFYVYGRNQIQDSSKATPWNTTTLPLIINQNGGNENYIEMSKGDSVTFMLIYDSSNTTTVNNYSEYYTARIITHLS